MSLEDFTPSEIPPEILSYEAELIQLKPGRSGKLGVLTLGFEKEQLTGRTVIRDQFCKVPLFAMKALYLEETLPEMAYVYIMSPSGGMLQGDRYKIELNLSKEAKVHITTQGATRIYKMDKNYATQIVKINIDNGCYLEYIPDQIIPYRDSRFYQISDITVHEGGNLVYSEIIVPGRVASGESFEYDICYLKTQARDQDGNLRFNDVYLLEPKKNELRHVGLLDDNSVFASVYIITSKIKAKEVLDKLNLRLKEKTSVVGGATLLPKGEGVLVRLLGNYSEDLRKTINNIVDDTRMVLIGAKFSGVRKY